MSTVIVYFSRDNNTRAGAKILGEKINAKLIELKEINKGNFIQAIFKRGSKLKGNPWKEIEDAKIVYLMSPIWASNGVPAMNAFFDKAEFSGKEINIITFQQFEDFKGSEKVHKYIKEVVENKKGTVKNCYALLGGKIGHFAGDNNIKVQIDQILE